jgi:hypothetical protein
MPMGKTSELRKVVPKTVSIHDAVMGGIVGIPIQLSRTRITHFGSPSSGQMPTGKTSELRKVVPKTTQSWAASSEFRIQPFW